MKVRCLYRWSPFSEIISSRYDTETGLIDGVDANDFNVVINSSMWKEGNYQGGEVISLATAEQYMMENRKCNFCVECDNLGFYCLMGTFIIFLYDDFISRTQALYEVTEKQLQCDYAYIGYRPTKVIQFSGSPVIDRLLYDKQNQCVITRDGRLKLSVGLGMIGPLNKNFIGYNKLVLDNLYAVMYDKEGAPIFLRKEDNYLKMV